MNVTCKQLVELLIDYVDGTLDLAQKAELDEHFRICPDCLYYLESYQVTIQLTKTLPRCSSIPAEMEARLRDVYCKAITEHHQQWRGGTSPE